MRLLSLWQLGPKLSEIHIDNLNLTPDPNLPVHFTTKV